jgi:hypothetical protein
MGNYAVFVVILVIFGSYMSFLIYQSPSKSQTLFIIIYLIVISIHSQRKDTIFIKQKLERSHLNIFFEYFIFSLPFTIGSLLQPHSIFYFAIYTVGLYIISLLNFPEKKLKYGFIKKIIPLSIYEWRSGLRRSHNLAILFYLMALCGIGIKFLPHFFLWITSIGLISFYDENEPIEILTSQEQNANSFLNNKLKKHVGFMLALYAPIMGLNYFLFSSNLYINVAFLLSQAALLAFGIITKYKHYLPSFSIMKNSNLTSIIAIAALLPFTFFLPTLFSIFFYQKAISNIKPYFND